MKPRATVVSALPPKNGRLPRAAASDADLQRLQTASSNCSSSIEGGSAVNGKRGGGPALIQRLLSLTKSGPAPPLHAQQHPANGHAKAEERRAVGSLTASSNLAGRGGGASLLLAASMELLQGRVQEEV